MTEKTEGQISGVKKRDKPTLSRKYQQAGIIKPAADTAQDVWKYLDENPEKTLGTYGHSIGMLGHIIAGTEGKTPEEQVEYLKPRAENLIKKYGKHIISFMRPELREALGIKPEAEIDDKNSISGCGGEDD